MLIMGIEIDEGILFICALAIYYVYTNYIKNPTVKERKDDLVKPKEKYNDSYMMHEDTVFDKPLTKKTPMQKLYAIIAVILFIGIIINANLNRVGEEDCFNQIGIEICKENNNTFHSTLGTDKVQCLQEDRTLVTRYLTGSEILLCKGD